MKNYLLFLLLMGFVISTSCSNDDSPPRGKDKTELRFSKVEMEHFGDIDQNGLAYYSISLTSSTVISTGKSSPSQGDYILRIACYAELNDPLSVPAGAFTPTKDHTTATKFNFVSGTEDAKGTVLFQDISGSTLTRPIQGGSFTITPSANGYKVAGELKDHLEGELSFSFEGALNIKDLSEPKDIEVSVTMENGSGLYLGRSDKLFIAEFSLDLFNQKGAIREGVVLNGFSDLVIDPEDFCLVDGDYKLSDEKKLLSLIEGKQSAESLTGSYYYKKNGEQFIHKVLINQSQFVATLGSQANKYSISSSFSGVDLVTGAKATKIEFNYLGEINFSDKSTPIAFEEHPRGYLFYKEDDTNLNLGRVVIVLQSDLEEANLGYHGVQIETFIPIPEDWYNIVVNEGYYRISEERRLMGLTPGAVSPEKKLSGTFGYESIVMQGTRNVVTADQGMIKITKSGENHTLKALLRGVNYETGEREDILTSFTGVMIVENETPAPPATWEIVFTDAVARDSWGAIELTLTREENGVIKTMLIDMYTEDGLEGALAPGSYVIDDSEDPFTIYPGEFDEIYSSAEPTSYWEDDSDSSIYQYHNAVPATDGSMNIEVVDGRYIITFEFKGINNDTDGEVTIKGRFEGEIEFKASPWRYKNSRLPHWRR